MRSKKYLFLSFVLLFPSLLFSQKIRIGPNTGLNINTIEKTDLRGTSFSLGFQAGGIFEYQINNWFSLSANLMYSGKRKCYEKNSTSSFFETISELTPFLSDTSTGNSFSSIIASASEYLNDTVYSKTKGFVKIGYIELPAMAKFSFKGFSFSAGPYLAILVSNNATEELTQDVPILRTIEPTLDTVPLIGQLVVSMFPGYKTPVVSYNVKSGDIKKLDYGFISELAYQASNNLTFSLRYTKGIPDYRSPELSKNEKLSLLNFSVGYLFNLKKAEEINLANPQFQ